MNRTLIGTLITATVGLSACGPLSSERTEPSGAPEIRPSLEMLGNSRDRYDGIATGCAGSEDVAVSVFSHWVVSETVDANGALHVNGHIDWTFKGTGVVTGAQYVGVEQDKLTATFPAGSPPARSATEVFHGWLIGQGGVANIRFRLLYHITRTPDGTVAVVVESFDLDC